MVFIRIHTLSSKREREYLHRLNLCINYISRYLHRASVHCPRTLSLLMLLMLLLLLLLLLMLLVLLVLLLLLVVLCDCR